MEPTDDYDPDASVWRAVAELERKGFTKGEIADTLAEVSIAVRDESTQAD